MTVTNVKSPLLTSPPTNWYDHIKQGLRVEVLVNLATAIKDTGTGKTYTKWKTQLDNAALGTSDTITIEVDAAKAEWAIMKIADQTFDLAEIEYSNRQSFILRDPRFGTNKVAYSVLTLSSQNAALMVAKQVQMEMHY